MEKIYLMSQEDSEGLKELHEAPGCIYGHGIHHPDAHPKVHDRLPKQDLAATGEAVGQGKFS